MAAQGYYENLLDSIEKIEGELGMNKNYMYEYKRQKRHYWENKWTYYRRKIGQTRLRVSAIIRDIFLVLATGALWYAFGYGCYAANKSVQTIYQIGAVENKIDIREKTLDTYKQVNVGLGSNTFDFNTFKALTEDVDKLYETKAVLQKSKVPTDFEGGFMIPLGVILSIFTIAGLIFLDKDHDCENGRYYSTYVSNWEEITEEEYEESTKK